jgi:broad specificity phosphatase PhoE
LSEITLTLYFLRHGQTECSRSNFYCGSINPELTADGLEMATAIADKYTNTPWTAIFSSPMQRAIATVKPLCDRVQIQPELRDGLKEIDYGKWEGKTAETVNNEFHDDYIRWLADPAWYAPVEKWLLRSQTGQCQ